MKITDLPIQTRLIQLAEECSECSQAALKWVRAMNGDTPVSETEARSQLAEEIADVSVCITALSNLVLSKDVCEIIVRKAQRWEDRINGKR